MAKVRLWAGVTLLLLLHLQLGIAAFCKQLIVSGASKLICYYTNWSQHRSGPAKFTTAEVDPNLCTHLIYAYVGIENNKITSTESNADPVYKQFNDLKKQNTNLTTMVAVGGGSFGSRFSPMLANSQNRKTFIDSVVSFLIKHNFNGIDLDFEFPGTNGSPPEDTQQFSLLVQHATNSPLRSDLMNAFGIYKSDKRRSCSLSKTFVIKGNYLKRQELSTAFEAEAASSGQPRHVMSAAVSASKDTIDGSYDAPTLGRYLDFINVMMYDFHGSRDNITYHNSPLHRGSTEQGNSTYLNNEFAMNYWKNKGVPAEKLMMGIPAFGRTFKLSPSTPCEIGVPVSGVGAAGKFTGQPGILPYYEICGLLKGATFKFSDDQKVPYACKGDQWIGYDNATSIGYKADFLKSRGFGGATIWALDLDDFSGTFCKEGKYPLIKKLKQTLLVNSGTPGNPTKAPTKPTRTTTPPK